MRYIFVDEAGISETEPVTIVAGIILHADQHLVLAETLLNEVLGAVPRQIREDFHFHATDVWNNEDYREFWEMTDRLNFLCEMMRIPRRIGMAISMGLVRREADFIECPFPGLDWTLEQSQHYGAFKGCLQKADAYIRDYCDVREVGTVVAEDNKDMRKYLSWITKPVLRNAGSVAPTRAYLRPTELEKN